MSEQWMAFVIVVSIQLVLFLIHAYYEKELRLAPRLLVEGMILGLVFGILFDLIVGKFFGVFSYHLGFTYPFLIINGLFSYGFMYANTLLMRDARFLHFYFWSVLVGAIYEITNYFYPVWTWEFGSAPLYEYVIVIGIAYYGIAFLMAVCARPFISRRFHIVDYFLR